MSIQLNFINRSSDDGNSQLVQGAVMNSSSVSDLGTHNTHLTHH